MRGTGAYAKAGHLPAPAPSQPRAEWIARDAQHPVQVLRTDLLIAVLAGRDAGNVLCPLGEIRRSTRRAVSAAAAPPLPQPDLPLRLVHKNWNASARRARPGRVILSISPG